MAWNQNENQRQMPWKGEKDAYKIWLSEIILQQTRVEQGLKYYNQFIDSYPTVEQLSVAPDDEVLKHWEGLGYYSRCRNLLHTARFITENLKGKFPESYEEIVALKGVGSYTASAIASFAYNLPYAVLDGNVFRVLSRITGSTTPIDTIQGKKWFDSLAKQALDVRNAGEYNQAIMDFGATICKPIPECDNCFFNKHCKAFLTNIQDQLPVKEKKLKIEERWLNYMIFRDNKGFWISQRNGNDIWRGLYQFPLLETTKSISEKQLTNKMLSQYSIPLKQVDVRHLLKLKQKLTHQLIHFSFTEIRIKEKLELPGYQYVDVETLKKLAFPRTLKQVIQNELLSS